jgi:two-component system nitrogen regulation sensor histidine kinase NtrY
VLSLLRPGEPGLWERIRRFDLERRLALVLTVGAIVSGIATWVAISGTPPSRTDTGTVLVLLNLDLILLLLLGIVIARRLVALYLQRRQGSAGSRLHVRLVALFGAVASAPAILVAVFSVFFLSSGLEAWFSERVRSALENSLAVAEAYLAEHKEIIRADALAMAADLTRDADPLLESPEQLRQLVNTQAALRSLTEAIVFDSTGRVLARSGLSFTMDMEIERLSPTTLEQAAAGDVVVLTSDTDDRVRALVRLDGYGGAFLFVGRFVDANVLGFMERTQQVVSEYRQMERQRSGIQITSALIFAVVALLLLFAAVWIGLTFANELATPISRLIDAADRVRGGDLMARVPEGPEADEVGVLSRAFNRMTSQLASQRDELIRANQQLDARRRFTETVLAGVSAGVIGLDDKGRIVLANRAAADFLSGAEAEPIGRSLAAVLPETAPLLQQLALHPDAPVTEQLAVRHNGAQRSLLVRVAAQGDGAGIAGYVLTFDDVTELISAQRQAAWSEVARRIAHEVKNPLTPIRLSAERLSRKYLPQIKDEREAFKASIDTIVRQVDVIGRLISEFSAFARMPAPVFRNESLVELARQALNLQRLAWPQIQFRLEVPADDPVLVPCDGHKIGQALTNLLQNAVDALVEGRGEAAPPGEVTLRVLRHPGGALVEVADNGPGFPTAERERLFEPYVTTRRGGTGLGLAIVRKIMEEHGGKVELADCGGGALVRLSLPDLAGRAGSRLGHGGTADPATTAAAASRLPAGTEG